MITYDPIDLEFLQVKKLLIYGIWNVRTLTLYTGNTIDEQNST